MTDFSFTGYALLPLSLLLVVSLSACNFLGSDDPERIEGIIAWQAQGAATVTDDTTRSGPPVEHLSAPDIVQAGKSFEIQVTTVGLSGCWEEAGAEITTGDHRITVVPYDIDNMRPGVFCTGALVDLTRAVEATFSEPGEAEIVVQGRKVLDAEGDNITRETTTELRQTVWVE